MEHWVAIGRLWRARGNRGELLGELDSSDRPGQSVEGSRAYALNGQPEGGAESRKSGRHDGRPVFKFEGVDSISDAEKLEGSEILVPPGDVALPEEGAYSHAELVGCRVEGDGTFGRRG